ncbi:MAG TPA: DNA polymerase [Kangiella sp.]
MHTSNEKNILTVSDFQASLNSQIDELYNLNSDFKIPPKPGHQTKDLVTPEPTKKTKFQPLPAGADSFLEQMQKEVAELYANLSDPNLIQRANGPVVHIGIDSEFHDNNHEVEQGTAAKLQNTILSYQTYLYCDGKISTMIVYPKGPKKSDRIPFNKLLSKAINKAKDEGVIDEFPSLVNCYAHFVRADIASFKDCFNMKKDLAGIGGTVASVSNPYTISIEDESAQKYRPAPLVLTNKHRRKYSTFVKFYDTMLHTPGRGGLAVAGDMIGLEKLELPEGYSIDRMDKLLEFDKSSFEKYAMRDAEISCGYGVYLQQFVRNELGLTGLPPTIGASSVAALRQTLKPLIEEYPTLGSFNQIFGISIEKEEYWNERKARLQTRKKKEVTPTRYNHKSFVTSCYHGGRNEGIYTGPTVIDSFIDLDLRGAYTIGLCDLLPIDYDRIYTSYDVADYLGHTLGFAYVQFEYSKSVRFPSLPVSAGSKGIIFPQKGFSYCTAPEIQVAATQGCKIIIKHGIIAPWKNEKTRLFKPFVTKVRQERNNAKNLNDKAKDSYWKEIGNSAYGKLAQGLKNKMAFDTSTGKSKKISESAITNEFYASHVTGFVRAVIAELLNSIPQDKTVVSVTTDGFLSNVTIDDLDLTGANCQRYQQLCHEIDGGHMLEEKSRAKQIIGMKTRGQLTAIGSEGSPPILAKAGIKLPTDYKPGMCKNAKKQAENDIMIGLYLDREYNDPPMAFSTLVSLREQWLLESDLVRKYQKRRINMEFDFKRKPYNLRMLPVRDTEHLSFDSQPWNTIEQFKEQRALFDSYRRSNNLKTMKDWEQWLEYSQVMRVTKGKGINVSKKGSDDLLRRLFLRAYSQECWGLLKDKSYTKLAHWLTEYGYETSTDELKNAKRAKLVEHVIPLTPKVIKLLRLLVNEYPSLELDKFIEPSSLDEVLSLLND